MIQKYHHWRLTEDHQIVGCSLMEWARWFENVDARRVDETIIDGIRVSTVFLGIDHNFGRLFNPEADQRPVLFETMIFDVEGDRSGLSDLDYLTRCCTWDEAVDMHGCAVQAVRSWIVRADLEPIWRSLGIRGGAG